MTITKFDFYCSLLTALLIGVIIGIAIINSVRPAL